MSKRHFLDFEQPIAELESKIDELRYVQSESAVDISEEIERLGKKSQQLTKEIYASLTPWQVTQIARHPQRPYTLDYVAVIFTDFQELHGDRHYADDQSIVGGLARFNGQACMVVGHQKGRDTKERTARNFGMSRPEGYRKALRLMKLAERFGLPVFSFVDTPGAYPGIGAEERGQAEAIAWNLRAMAALKAPIIVLIIGKRKGFGTQPFRPHNVPFVMLGAGLLFMRPIFGFGFIFCLVVGFLMLFLASRAEDGWHNFLLKLIGITSCLYAVLDIKSDILDRPHLHSDAVALQQLTLIPSVVWGVLWMALSIACTWWCLRLATRRRAGDETGD